MLDDLFSKAWLRYRTKRVTDQQTKEVISYLRSYADDADPRLASVARKASEDLEAIIVESCAEPAEQQVAIPLRSEGALSRFKRYAQSGAAALLLLIAGTLGNRVPEHLSALYERTAAYVQKAERKEVPQAPSPPAGIAHRPDNEKAIGEDRVKTPPSSVLRNHACPILMYHKIGQHEDRFTISPQTLRKHLDYLREHGYGLVTYKEYIEKDFSSLYEKRPAVLTFDDSSEGQFRMDAGAIDPESAVGVLEEYKRMHPRYRVTATFFINLQRDGKPAFEQAGSEQQKLEFLACNGYEIGAHSMHHADFARMSLLQIEDDVSSFKKEMARMLPWYQVKAFAYPYGSLPSRAAQQIVEAAYPYTAHAWGGRAHGQMHNTPRIEVGPHSQLSSYAPPALADLASESSLEDRGNVYKGEQNLRNHARNHSQLPPQHPQAIRRPDDRRRGRRGEQGEGKGPCRQDCGLQHGQEGDQGRGPLNPWQQGSAESPLRDWHAGPGNRPARKDPVDLLYFSQPMLRRFY
jgi:peptidoglycan/xylan/chitin deacetylase (PgdA/CDA1 family)